MGRSRPFSWLKIAISSGEAFGPSVARAAPPGRILVRMKVKRVTPKTTATDCANLRIRNPINLFHQLIREMKAAGHFLARPPANCSQRRWDHPATKYQFSG